MTNIDMNVERCEMNQGACDMTADELELVSGGQNLGAAAKIEAPAPTLANKISSWASDLLS
jgi:hypothetical protein